MKRWSRSALGLLLAISSPVSAYGAGYQGPVSFSIRDVLYYQPSHIQIKVPITAPVNYVNKFQTFNCPRWGQGDCADVAKPGVTFSANSIIPPCGEKQATFCIENFMLSQSSSTWKKASLIRSINGPTHEPVPEIGFPYSGTISLWQADSQLVKDPSIKFAVQVSVQVPWQQFNSKPVAFEDLQMRIIPYRDVSGSFIIPKLEDYVDQNGYHSFGIWPFPENSVWSDDIGRGEPVAWPEGLSASLSVRLPKSVTGWLGGRIQAAEFNVQNLSSNVNLLTVAGVPVKIQNIELQVDQKNATERLANMMGVKDGNWAGGYVFDASQIERFSPLIDELRPFAQDKSKSAQESWVVKSFTNSQQNCLGDNSRIVGFVATNASAYSGKAPQFKDGKIDYSVAAMHYDADGNIARGTYDLVLRSDVARCLYGFSAAPIDATISITSNGQSQQIATSVTGERNGWLFISAKNFTFSNPTIQVALSQKSSSSAPAKIKRITCIKGKSSKVVSGLNPICPTGYKLVAK